MPPTDLLRKPLVQGDYVFVTRKNYRDIVLARIVRFTPQQVRVVYPTYNNYFEEYLTSQVVKVDPVDLENRPQSRAAVDAAYHSVVPQAPQE